MNEIQGYNIFITRRMRPKYKDFQAGKFVNGSLLLVFSQPTILDELFPLSLTGKYCYNALMADNSGLNWSNVSYTYVIKSKKANQTDKDEYEEFFPILISQIDATSPKLIACIGQYAGSVFQLTENYYARRYKNSIVCMYPTPSSVVLRGIRKMKQEEQRFKESVLELLSFQIHNETQE